MLRSIELIFIVEAGIELYTGARDAHEHASGITRNVK